MQITLAMCPESIFTMGYLRIDSGKKAFPWQGNELEKKLLHQISIEEGAF